MYTCTEETGELGYMCLFLSYFRDYILKTKLLYLKFGCFFFLERVLQVCLAAFIFFHDKHGESSGL